jgi:hypothetical protein
VEEILKRFECHCPRTPYPRRPFPNPSLVHARNPLTGPQAVSRIFCDTDSFARFRQIRTLPG